MNFNIYISKDYIDFFEKQIKEQLLNKKMFDRENVNINFISDYDDNINYDVIIKFKNNYKNADIIKMNKNKTFINFFIKKNDELSNKKLLRKNINLYPYTFYMKNFDKEKIDNNISRYKNLYKNNDINKDYGENVWIVKDNRGQMGIGTDFYSTEQLLNIKKKDYIVQKYLEKPLLNKYGKKLDIRIHVLIIPIIKYNEDTKLYEFKINKKGKIKIHYYLHNQMIARYTGPNYELNFTDKKKHLTNAYIQGKNNQFTINDVIFYKKIREKIQIFFKQSKIKDIIINDINGFYYFYKIIAFDIISTEHNHDVDIVDLNTDPLLNYKSISDSNLMILCFQKILNMICKIKYNKKYKVLKLDNHLYNFLDKIK